MNGPGKKIAIVTGASGGLGKEFVKLLLREENIDEIWAIAKNEEKLILSPFFLYWSFQSLTFRAANLDVKTLS